MFAPLLLLFLPSLLSFCCVLFSSLKVAPYSFFEWVFSPEISSTRGKAGAAHLLRYSALPPPSFFLPSLLPSYISSTAS
ncbi:hypothetical protein BDY24DRAFT_405029 [Mrakia frigida]|uniref:uncharacterized protein n=1 Tax=Mrakia frigida TaxID=29902 RepID=UPI003FCC0D32